MVENISFDWERPAWLITIIDATVAWLVWFAYRHHRQTIAPSVIRILNGRKVAANA